MRLIVIRRTVAGFQIEGIVAGVEETGAALVTGQELAEVGELGQFALAQSFFRERRFRDG